MAPNPKSVLGDGKGSRKTIRAFDIVKVLFDGFGTHEIQQEALSCSMANAQRGSSPSAVGRLERVGEGGENLDNRREGMHHHKLAK